MKVPKPEKTKSGKWYIRMRLNGVSVPVVATTKAGCIAQARLIKAEYKAKKRNIERTEADGITLRQSIDKYIAERKNSLSPSTVRGYRTIQRCRFQAFMDEPISSIKNWQSVYDSEKNRLASKTLNNSFSLVKSVYEDTTGRKMPKVDKLQTVSDEREFLDYEEILIFCEAIKGKPWETEALLALHSLRASEILDLTWDDIDFKKWTIRVRGATVPDEHNRYVHKDTNKTTESVRFPPVFIPRLRVLLQEKHDRGDSMRYYKRTGNLNEMVKRVCEENGLPITTLHGLRHSFASLCFHLSIPEDVVQKLGGWSDYMTVHRIYTHISKRDMRKHTEDLENFFKMPNILPN